MKDKQSIIKDFESSGLSLKKYCRQNNLIYNTVKKWRYPVNLEAINNQENYSFKSKPTPKGPIYPEIEN